MRKGGQESHGIEQKLNTVFVLCGNFIDWTVSQPGRVFLVLAVANREPLAVVPG